MIAKFSVKKPYTVLVGVVLAIVLGVVSFTKMTADLLPNISLPYVIVLTTYVGASPETVENAVTKPIESSMATVSNIESINSVSNENYSMVILEFAQTANMDSVSLEIRENLDQVKGYWEDDLIGNPIIMKLNPDMMPIMIAAAGMEGMDVAGVSAFIEEEIIPELESVEGVASVNGTGLIEESVHVVIRQEKIDAVNARIQGYIDGQMGDAGKGLADGRAEVEDGLKQLEDGFEELEDAQAKLDSGRRELEKGKRELAQKRAELDNEAVRAMMGEEAYGEAMAQLDAAEAQLNATEAQLNSSQRELDAARAQMEETRQQLLDALAQIEEGEQELADARQDAYDAADMTDVLTTDLVSSLLYAQNFSMPAGYVTEEGTAYLVRVGDKPQTAEELADMPILNLHIDGVDTITLGDVADVFYTDNSDQVYANVNGSPGVMLTIQKQTGYSTGEVSDRLTDKFAKLMEQYEGLKMITLMDQGIYIDLVMDSIINNIVLGAILAIFILLLFLKDLRPTLVVAFAIPISLVTAIVCMYFSGVTLNVISLSGLALGIGMLVDNSIVVIENIYRMRGEGRSTKEAAIQGAKEVSGAIVASTLTTVCVFAPIVFTEGITRQLFVDMGLTIAYSLLASLLVAMTVVPAMASKLLEKTKEKKEGKLFGAMTRGYEKLLSGALKVKPLVLLAVLALLIGSAAAAFSNGTAFMTDMDSPQLTVNVNLGDEATLADTKEVTDEVVRRIREIEDIVDVGAMASTSTMGLLTGGSGAENAATIYVAASEDKQHSNEELADMILERTADLPAEITVDASSMDMSALGGSGITIRVEGREIDTLQRIAAEVAQLIEQVEGTAEVSNGLEETDEELRILVDRDAAMEYGLTVAQVFAQVSDRLLSSGTATTLVAAEKDYGVYVKSEADEALTRQLLQTMMIEGTGKDGASVKVAFSEIASFESARSLTSIRRADQTRYISVTAGIADGYNIGKVSAAVERKLADYEMPEGYKLVYAGENEMINDALKQMVLMLVLALVFMYLIMVAQFQSLLSPFIIMFTIPLAFTGGLAGLFVTGSEVSVIAMIGFVMLSGIIVNNGIVLIDYINQLREEGMDKKQAILTAGRTRLRPVLMTALTTILALSTMVFSRDMGAEMGRSMAIVVIGGLTYGTLLTLVVIPCVYDLISREKKDKAAKGRDAAAQEAPADEVQHGEGK